MTIDDLAALLQGARVFAPGSLVVVRTGSDFDIFERRQLADYFRQLRDRAGFEFLFVAADISFELAGQTVAVNDLTVALLEARRQSSVQDQAAALLKRFIVLHRPEAHG